MSDIKTEPRCSAHMLGSGGTVYRVRMNYRGGIIARLLFWWKNCLGQRQRNQPDSEQPHRGQKND